MAEPRQQAAHRVVVVGSANADLVVEVPRRPAAGETLLGSDLHVGAGGKGANQAVAAALLGADVTFVARVGDDEHGRLLTDSLRSAGVGLAGLRTVRRPTGVALIQVTPDGENSIVVAAGANSELTPEELDADAARITAADLLVAQLEVPLETIAHAASVAAQAGTRLLLNAAPAQSLPSELLALCDPLVVNESEAAAILVSSASTDVPEEIVAALRDLGARSVVLTLGARGAVICEGTPATVSAIPAERVRAVDTTGAGDAFVGALAAELAAGASLIEAADFATQVAGYAVGHRGAQASYPSRAQLARNQRD